MGDAIFSLTCKAVFYEIQEIVSFENFFRRAENSQIELCSVNMEQIRNTCYRSNHLSFLSLIVRIFDTLQLL